MRPSDPGYICTSCARALRNRTLPPVLQVRAFSNASHSVAGPVAADGDAPEHVPRWKRTPAVMKMPIRLRPVPKQPRWEVNDRQEPVDEAYDAFLGRIGGNTRGRDMLDEETKWLALTHKSYAQGTQGINDRLAFLGKRIVDLQTSLTLLRAPAPLDLRPHSARDVFLHPSLNGLDNISPAAKGQVLESGRLAGLAQSYGIDRVVRWKPRKSDNLASSGVDTVLAHTMYSIIGALALKKGGEVAARTARERILQPLGLK